MKVTLVKLMVAVSLCVSALGCESASVDDEHHGSASNAIKNTHRVESEESEDSEAVEPQDSEAVDTGDSEPVALPASASASEPERCIAPLTPDECRSAAGGGYDVYTCRGGTMMRSRHCSGGCHVKVSSNLTTLSGTVGVCD